MVGLSLKPSSFHWGRPEKPRAVLFLDCFCPFPRELLP